MKTKCKHKWVDMEDGSDRLICVKCVKFVAQARLSLPLSAEMSVPFGMPLGRGKVEVPYLSPNGEHTRVSAYKDDLIKQIQKEVGLSISLFASNTRL